MDDKNQVRDKKNHATRGWLSRYRGLVGSITIFLIILASLLGFGIYSGNITQQDNLRIIIYSQIRDLTQSITRDLFNLRLNYGEDPTSPHMDYTIKRLQQYSDILSQNIDALEYGQPARNISGGEIAIATQAAQNEAQYLNTIKHAWQTYHGLIDNYLATAQSFSATVTPLDLAVFQAQESSETIYQETVKVENMVAEQAQSRGDLLRLIQAVGIALIIVYFLIFLFVFIRRIIRTDRKADVARQETTEIMQTIQEGLFLIDENLQIGQQTSEKLASIVPGRSFSGEQMETVLHDIVESKDIDNTRRFIKQLFNERIDEQLIEGLNPLQEIKIRVQRGGRIQPRYIRFIFTRVWEDDAIKRVLVSVTDITDAVQLRQRLEKERKQNEQQMELLVKILHISPTLLSSFLRNARLLTEHVNDILRRPERGTSDLKQKAREILRNIHSFKGESAALGLDHFVDSCEMIEDRLKEVLERQKVTGNDFMRVTIVLDELMNRIHSIEDIQENLQHITEDNMSAESKASKDIKEYYVKFAEGIAARHDKSAHLEIKEYDFSAMSDQVHDHIKEIIVQLIRNAVVHGIETKPVRKSLDKVAEGRLSLSLRNEGDDYVLSFSDDGSGIDYVELRRKVKQLEQYADNPEQIDMLSEQALNRFIFTSGLSTAKHADSDAGRGVGMDVVKDRLHALGGRIALRSKPDAGTQFVIRIPHNYLTEVL